LVGKQTGKDAVAGKATMVGVLGVAGAKSRLKALVADARAALAPFGKDAEILIEGARFVAERLA
jgi:farnesyl diphosphate synthase